MYLYELNCPMYRVSLVWIKLNLLIMCPIEHGHYELGKNYDIDANKILF